MPFKTEKLELLKTGEFEKGDIVLCKHKDKHHICNWTKATIVEIGKDCIVVGDNQYFGWRCDLDNNGNYTSMNNNGEKVLFYKKRAYITKEIYPIDKKPKQQQSEEQAEQVTDDDE